MCKGRLAVEEVLFTVHTKYLDGLLSWHKGCFLTSRASLRQLSNPTQYSRKNKQNIFHNPADPRCTVYCGNMSTDSLQGKEWVTWWPLDAVDAAAVVAAAVVDWTRYQPHHERTQQITLSIHKRYAKDTLWTVCSAPGGNTFLWLGGCCRQFEAEVVECTTNPFMQLMYWL